MLRDTEVPDGFDMNAAALTTACIQITNFLLQKHPDAALLTRCSLLQQIVSTKAVIPSPDVPVVIWNLLASSLAPRLLFCPSLCLFARLASASQPIAVGSARRNAYDATLQQSSEAFQSPQCVGSAHLPRLQIERSSQVVETRSTMLANHALLQHRRPPN